MLVQGRSEAPGAGNQCTTYVYLGKLYYLHIQQILCSLQYVITKYNLVHINIDLFHMDIQFTYFPILLHGFCSDRYLYSHYPRLYFDFYATYDPTTGQRLL